MVHLEAVPMATTTATGITVHLPRTTLVVVATDRAYVMCGALDVRLLDARLGARRIVAARVVGARTVAELLAAPIDDLTAAAAATGAARGMPASEALARMHAGASPPDPP